MPSKPATLLSLCLILALLGAGCGDDKKKVDTAAAKEWQQKTPPSAYLQRMKGMTGAPAAHGGPPVAAVPK